MATAPLTAHDRRSQVDAARRLGTPPAAEGASVPVLEPAPAGLAERFARACSGRHPVTVFVSAVLVGYVILAALSVAFGLLLTHALLQSGAVARADERVVAWLVAHRTGSLTEASLIGSIVAGGVVIPTVVGLTAVFLACLKQWRIAGFLIAAIMVEVATYRVATLLVHRDRPPVARIEDLPVDASYPSGHTAAAIAVYCGLALVLTSRIRNTWFRVGCWSLAVAVPMFVAVARMYRGMHHPLDTVAGGLIGVSALLVAVFAARAAGFAALQRERER